MKFLCSSKIRMVLVGFVAAFLVGGGGNANAEFIFGTPTNLGPTVNSSAWDNSPSISADGLSLFFQSERGGGYGGEDIWVTTRATKADPWGTPVNLGPTVNSSSHDFCPCISADDLSLSFTSDRPGGYGFYDLWVTRRATKEDPWGTPVNLGPTVNSSAGEVGSAISADGLTLFFGGYSSGPYRPGGFGMSDLWVTTRLSVSHNWGPPVNLGPTVNSASADYVPSISADGLTLFFGSNRPGGYGDRDIWVTRRATANEPWGEPVNLGPTVNSASTDYVPSISADGLMLFFGSNRPGGFGSYDLWQVSITLVIDFNGDGRIDFKDFSILAQYWLQDESLVDIAPPPLGDDMVDLKDIVVFAENWLIGTRKASNPHPWNGATNVDINADLSWTAGVDATSHDVYFGTTDPPPFIRNQAAETFDPGTLAENTGHYWRIDEVGAYGTTTGTVWRFTSGWGGPPP